MVEMMMRSENDSDTITEELVAGTVSDNFEWGKNKQVAYFFP